MPRLVYARSPAAQRIASAREAAGLSPDDVADRLGLSDMEYYDLEAYDHEAFTSIAIEDLCRLADLLGVSPISLVAPPRMDSARAVSPVSAERLVASLSARMHERNEDPEAFGTHVGWEVSEILASPDALWRIFNLDGLQDLCRSAGLDWLDVLAGWPRVPSVRGRR